MRNPPERPARHATLTRRLIRRALALYVDRRGVSVVEFALVVPVLLLLLLGMSDLVPAIVAKFRVAHANESTADMAAEYTQLQTSDMVNVFSVAANVMAPLPSTKLNVRLTNIYTDGNGNAKVYWSCANGSFTPYTANSLVTSTPTGSPVTWFVSGANANAKNTSYVMSEISYQYTAIVGYVIAAPVSMTNTAYLLPRSSNYLGFPWDGVSSDAPPTPTSTTTSAALTLSNGATCNYAK